MKNILAFLLLSLVFAGCANEKKQEKDLLDEVINIHDRVMGKEDTVMTAKMQLDTLLRQNKTAAILALAQANKKKLDDADARMMDWMHQFDAENKGKTHTAIINYLNDQKKQIAAIDSQLNSAIATSGEFIKQNKPK